MRAVGIIHARGGSKRIPLKNIEPLLGKPLIGYIIEAALGARSLDRVLVSSDHEGIMQVAREFGAEVPFVRPADIAEDVPSELVTQHAVTFLEEQGYPVDVAVTFQPTTPFCLPEDVDGCLNLLVSTGADSVFSGYEVSERPEWMFLFDEEGMARNFLSSEMTGDIGVSQTLPRMYLPNGGIYATRRDVLFEQNAIIGKSSRIWVMPKERSIDIDEPIDFLVAEVVGRHLLDVGLLRQESR
jgi:CMP-N,N'-diacetyllegionaminic acid synthase